MIPSFLEFIIQIDINESNLTNTTYKLLQICFLIQYFNGIEKIFKGGPDLAWKVRKDSCFSWCLQCECGSTKCTG